MSFYKGVYLLSFWLNIPSPSLMIKRSLSLFVSQPFFILTFWTPATSAYHFTDEVSPELASRDLDRPISVLRIMLPGAMMKVLRSVSPSNVVS